ncbi:MAG: hypothetical protein NW201_07320 [Gemmatimonadales bacterium]|nr:hypothetical protein [Gemmatimonadales bacterium]
MLRTLRLVVRVFGWLLTPLVAWAASFLGATLAAAAVAGVDAPMRALGATAATAMATGALALIAWLALLRRRPDLRDALAVSEEGLPDTATFEAPVATDLPPPAPPAP